jgi:hypothetical protein
LRVSSGTEQKTEARTQQLLDQAGAVRFREQAAVQEQAGLPAPHAEPLVLPRQHFLRHRVAVVVGQHMKLLETELLDEHLADIRLLHDAVVVADGLGAEAEAEQVHGHEAVVVLSAGQIFHQSQLDVGKSVDQQDRAPLRLHRRLIDEKDAVVEQLQVAARAPPSPRH